MGTQMIDFLEHYKYSTFALVVVSIPVFGFLVIGTMMFCDAPGAGPAGMKFSAIFVIILSFLDAALAALFSCNQRYAHSPLQC
jgi:ABC-type anion transport system duplicated permease subunit